MEARVDIKKLQLLNDRIVQTIEALNQVRLSVHGLQHSAMIPNVAFAQPPIAPIGALGTMPQASVGIPPMQSPYAVFAATPYGLQHTSLPQFQALQSLYGQTLAAQVPQAAGYANVFGAPSFTPWAQPAVGLGGLSHSTVEEQWLAELRATDPRRVAQTFPFVYNT